MDGNNATLARTWFAMVAGSPKQAGLDDLHHVTSGDAFKDAVSAGEQLQARLERDRLRGISDPTTNHHLPAELTPEQIEARRLIREYQSQL